MRKITAVVVASAGALSLAGGASAHGIIVTPPGQTAVVNQPVSQPFAQAHCHAQSPAELSNSPAAAQFVPGAALPCPGVPNPGGQVTGP